MLTKDGVKCPVCLSDEAETFCAGNDILYGIVRNIFSICQCNNCDALFIVPFPNQKETELYYPKNYYSYDISEKNGFFENVKEKIVRSAMEPEFKLGILDRIIVCVMRNKFSGIPLYAKKDGKFLDIGCGNGKNLKILKKYGWDVYGIELDDAAVKSAKNQGLNVQCTSIENAVFNGLRFDYIRIWHVFEHLTLPNESLKKICELLEDDGEIIMAVPNSESWAKKIFKKYWYGLDAPRHVINYCPKTLKYLINQNNLICKEIKYASCGSFVGSISNYLKFNFGYKNNLINNLFLIAIFSPLDYISDLLCKGDTIFLTIKKK